MSKNNPLWAVYSKEIIAPESAWVQGRQTGLACCSDGKPKAQIPQSEQKGDMSFAFIRVLVHSHLSTGCSKLTFPLPFRHQPIGEVLLNHIGECCIHCQTIEFIAKRLRMNSDPLWPIDCQLWFRVIWYMLNSWSTCCAVKHQFPLVNTQSLSKMSGFRTNEMQPSPKLFGMVDVTMMWRGRIDFSPQELCWSQKVDVTKGLHCTALHCLRSKPGCRNRNSANLRLQKKRRD